MVNVLQMTRAMESAFWTSSVRVFFLLDAECQGICTPDDVYHGICLLDEECQGIFPSGRRVSRHLYSGRCVPQRLSSGRGVSGQYSFWMQSVKAFVVQTTRATASASWTRSVTAFSLLMQHVSYGCRASRQFSSRRSVSMQMSRRGLRLRNTYDTEWSRW